MFQHLLCTKQMLCTYHVFLQTPTRWILLSHFKDEEVEALESRQVSPRPCRAPSGFPAILATPGSTTGHPGSQASSRGEANDSTLLSSRDAVLLEPPERPQGSPASSSVWILLSASANTRHFGTCLVVQGLSIHLPKLGMQPWALSLPDKELCLREALAVCTPPAPEPSAKRPGS